MNSTCPTQRFSARLVLMLLAAIPLSAGTATAAEPANAAGEAFFEKHIRPLLVTHCYSCHGAKEQESDLRLDSREALLKGGYAGSAAVAGKPAESLIMQMIGYEGDVKMPPVGKLPDAEIAAMRSWIEQGLPWPAGVVLQPGNSIAAAQQNHWSFRPLAAFSPPAASTLPPQTAAWVQNPVDQWVAARLHEAGLTPAPLADRRTLLRRFTFALWGLPPTPEQVEAFTNDPAPDADVLARWVDRLLASPHYGVRWGRHWLDIARYADTKGYVFTEEPRYPYAYTFRDYVIESLNADLPYDQFVREQLAADQFPRPDGDTRSLAALGFLTVGRRFSNNKHDIIDDRIDVLSRGLLGLTVTCARCHDHKYDPVPTADYYALYGVFASCEEPAEPPLIGKPEDTAEFRAFQQELGKLQGECDTYRDQQYAALLRELRTQAGDYFLAAVASKEREAQGHERPMLSLAAGDLRPSVLNRWRAHLQRQTPDNPLFGLWQQLKNTPEPQFAAKLKAWLAAPPSNTHPRLLAEVAAHLPADRDALALLYGKLLREAATLTEPMPADGAAAAVTAVQSVAGDLKSLAESFHGEQAPCYVDLDEAQRIFARDVKTRLSSLKKKVDVFRVNSPVAPPRAMVLVDAAQPVQPRILVRGNPGRPGDPVPRRFLSVLSAGEPQPFQTGSGRAELAKAVTAADNPLFARVIANRVWAQHFGEGLVRTASDFGARSDPPSHPELLDHLAATLIRSGWSLKALHREILLSATFQQQSTLRPECSSVDPENRLLWKWNRQRLEYEPLRDAMLAAAGQLDERFGGRSVDLFKSPFTGRRTAYGYIDRQELPAVFRVFDVANPDATSPGRPETTVAQQALYLLNSPFVMEQAQHLAARTAGISDAATRVTELYRLALARSPDPSELQLALAFVEKATAGKVAAWEKLAHALLCSNEFAFID